MVPSWRKISAGGWPPEAMLTTNLPGSSCALKRRNAAVVKRVVFKRNNARLRVIRTVTGSVSNIAAVRTVCRVSAVCDAASGPLPHTSPKTMPHVSSPSAKTS